MSTHQIGKDTKTLGLNMKIERAESIEARAKKMGLSTGQFCKIILFKFLDSGEKFTLSED